ncbi:MAG: HYR domain-containing protein, partial [Bacteroidota bacterium]
MLYSYKHLCSLFLCLTLACSTFGETIFVKANANGANNGQSWLDAFTNLADALEEAEADDQIWVASGTYYATATTNRSISLTIPNGVEILGGFPNTGNPTLTNRNPSVYQTIISGDIDQDGTLANNSYTIIYTKDVDATTILDGFSIIDGHADGGVPTDFPVTLENGGAAWYNEASSGNNSTPTIRNCIFSGHQATNRGGAMFHRGSIGGNANYTIESCAFVNNTAFEEGGAIFNSSAGATSACNPNISNTTFQNNVAGVSGGAVYNNGGFNGESSGTFTNCVFNSNEATAEEGGAVYNNAVFSGISSPLFNNCDFVNNDASPGSGGAIYTDASGNGTSDFRATNCRFEGNTSSVYGGAICNIISNEGFITPIYANCVFQDNFSDFGGATYSRAAFGGTIDVQVVNSIFYSNSTGLGVGGTIYQNQTGAASLVTTTVANSIFQQNTASFSPIFHLTGSATINVNNSLFDANGCLDLVQGEGTNEANCTGGNIYNQDPFFANPAAGDFHIVATSPAVDAGNNADVPSYLTLDADGNPRIATGIVDLGIFEIVNTTADSDDDGILDIDDNCPLVPNPDQANADGDQAGTLCDCDDSPATGVSCTTGCTTFYADNDGDGFGNPAMSVTTCVAPTGFVSDNTDFDDTDATLFPNAPELCDGKDNNNNGQTDEGTDDDGDGVCNEADICPGGDDNIDLNNNGTPDACESQISLSCPSDIVISATAGQTSAIVNWTEPTASTDCNDGGTGGGDCQDENLPGFVYKGEFDGHAYYLSDNGKIWTEAQSIAEANGGNLVAINDQAENDFVKSIIGNNIVHIGLTDQAQEGTYEWINGDPVTLNKLPSSPNGMDYGLMYFWDGSWDMSGNYSKFYVLEKSCGGGPSSGLTVTQTSGPANGTAFPIGTTTVTYTAEDACDGLKTCSFTVTVEATSSDLAITCPADITVSAAPGANTAIANWAEPTIISNCTTGTPTATPSQASGTAFQLGTTTVTYTATDDCGGTATCTFDVTVVENNSTVSITCPSDITVTADPGATDKIVTWANPSTSSDCTTGSVNVSASQASGTAFSIGTTTVTLTATDGCGATASCTFTVTVNEGTSILNLTCPPDIVVAADAGATSKVVNYSTPLGNTTCASSGVNLNLINGLTSGSVFPIGTTVVEYQGMDNCGSMATCSFNVTVNVVGSNLQINCPSDITESVSGAGETVAISWADPTGSTTCGTGGFSFTQTAGPASGSPFGVGSTTITYTATDACGGSEMCSFTVTVNLDNSSISLNCPSNISVNTPQGSGGKVVNWAAPTATTDCTVGGGTGNTCPTDKTRSGYTYLGEFNGSDYYISENKSPWLTAKSNAETAGGTLVSIENQAENDYIKSILAGEIVHIGLTDEANEGNPVWVSGEPTTFQNFSAFNPNNDERDYSVFYPWDGTWDWQSNGSWKLSMMEIKCGGPSPSIPVITQTAGLASGSSFPVGTTNISYQATDDCGNITTCSFTVTVTETVITCDPDTDGGEISGNEIICDPYDPQTITSSSLPSGGSDALEYVWLKSETGCPTGISQAIANTNSPTYNPPFITTTTYYVRWSRRTNCTNWVASNCITKTVDDCSGPSTDYCELSADQPWQEWISNVSLADLDNNSGKSLGYDDYTNLAANLTVGQAYTVSVQLRFSYNQWDEGVYVWMDFNQDNDFNDPGELVLEQVSPSNGNGGPQPAPNTQTFTVPTDAVTGTTRMRVAMKREMSTNPCGSFVHGEVEDYTLNISAGASNRAKPMLAFEAYAAIGQSILEWFSNTTDLEASFEVERSTDNEQFEKIDYVKVEFKGDFNSRYQLVDEQPQI